MTPLSDSSTFRGPVHSGRVPAALPRPDAGARRPLQTSATELLNTLLRSDVWHYDVGAVLDAVDAARPRRGTTFLYSARQLETVFVFCALHGCTSIAHTRRELMSPAGATIRSVIGLTAAQYRHIGGHGASGFPSDAVLHAHRERFPATDAVVALRRALTVVCGDRLRTDPEFAEALRILRTDTLHVPAHGGLVPMTAATRRSWREDRAAEAAQRADLWSRGAARARTARRPSATGAPVKPSASAAPTRVRVEPRGGSAVAILTSNAGDLLGVEAGYMGVTLTTRATTNLLADQGVQALLSRTRAPAQAGVLVLDGGGGDAQAIDPLALQLGYVPVRRPVGPRDHLRYLAVQRWAIEGAPAWSADGLGRLNCTCGAGSTWRRVDAPVDPTQPVRVGVSGRCDTCGPVTVTSGRWRCAHNPRRLVRARRDDADPQIGNPLTIGAPLTFAYVGHRIRTEAPERALLARKRSSPCSSSQIVYELLVRGIAEHLAHLQPPPARSRGAADTFGRWRGQTRRTGGVCRTDSGDVPRRRRDDVGVVLQR